MTPPWSRRRRAGRDARRDTEIPRLAVEASAARPGIGPRSSSTREAPDQPSAFTRSRPPSTPEEHLAQLRLNARHDAEPLRESAAVSTVRRSVVT
jgi:hypothetical protein